MKISTWFKSVAWFISVIAAGLSGIFFAKKTQKYVNGNEQSAQKRKEAVYEEIKDTPAGSLVSGADNAADLRADIGRISADAKERLRDRAGKIIQRIGSNAADRGTDDGGGNRN